MYSKMKKILRAKAISIRCYHLVIFILCSIFYIRFQSKFTASKIARQRSFSLSQYYLWYGKPGKTSGTYVSTVLEASIRRAGYKILSNPDAPCSEVRRTAAMLSHYIFNKTRIEEIERCTKKKVIFVTSVRKPADWYVSEIVRADRMKYQNLSCSDIKNIVGPYRKYVRYQPENDYYKDLVSIIRFENIEADLNYTLNILGIERSNKNAWAQPVRTSVHLDNCIRELNITAALEMDNFYNTLISFGQKNNLYSTK